MSGAPRPPGSLERVLAAALPDPTWRDAILGDLQEEHAELSRRRGRILAAAWYALQALRLGVRYGWRRARAQPEGGRRRGRRRGAMGDWIRRDLRDALRALGRRPLPSLLVVVTLALGLAANAAVFDSADALLVRPLAFGDVDRLVMFAEVGPGERFHPTAVAPAHYFEWRAGLPAVESLVALEWWSATLRGTDALEPIQGFRVSPGTLALLGAEPTLGRGFLPGEAEPGAPAAVVIGHALWSRRFGADPGVLGREIVVDGDSYTVVGVAPPGFEFPMGAELWSPLILDAEEAGRRDANYLIALGRLAPGSDLDALRAQLAVLDARSRREYPEEVGERRAEVRTLTAGVRDPGAGPILAVWQIAALLVLLIGCANVANLMLARGAERQRELAVRLALGAGRGRLLRQLLTESLVLGLLAAAVALPLAQLANGAMKDAVPASIVRFIPGWHQLGIDGRTAAVTLLLALGATALFGALPALTLSRPRLSEALREGGRSGSDGPGRRRWRDTLVVAEIAFSLALLVGAGLSLQAALGMLRGPQGYDPDGVLVGDVELPETAYADPAARRRFVEALERRLRALPGARAAAVANTLPSTGANTSRDVEVEGEVSLPSERRPTDLRTVSPGYFETLRLPVLAGRAFTAADGAEDARVAIVSRSFAERHWPGRDPLGRRIRIERDEQWLRVVGVAGDVVHHWFDRRFYPTVYRPYAQAPRFGLSVAVRLEGGDPEAAADALRSAVAGIDPERPVATIRSLRTAISDMTFGLQLAASVMAILAGVALVLAASGVYAIMAFRISRRTREIGVRVALGAGAGDVLALTLGQTLRLTGLGLVLGLVLAAGLARGMVAAFMGTVSPGPGVFVAFAAVLAAVSLLAGYLPARRALAVDPSEALRAE